MGWLWGRSSWSRYRSRSAGVSILTPGRSLLERAWYTPPVIATRLVMEFRKLPYRAALELRVNSAAQAVSRALVMYCLTWAVSLALVVRLATKFAFRKEVGVVEQTSTNFFKRAILARRVVRDELLVPVVPQTA